MSTIQIGAIERDLNEANESWIVQQVRSRQEDGQTVCVRLRLKHACVDMILPAAVLAAAVAAGFPTTKSNP